VGSLDCAGRPTEPKVIDMQLPETGAAAVVP
jgi:hypothetical protein